MRLEFADSGSAGLVAPREGDPDTSDGFGLSLVQTLSRCRGVERIAGTGTRVWAELGCSQLAAAQPGERR